MEAVFFRLLLPIGTKFERQPRSSQADSETNQRRSRRVVQYEETSARSGGAGVSTVKNSLLHRSLRFADQCSARGLHSGQDVRRDHLDARVGQPQLGGSVL